MTHNFYDKSIEELHADLDEAIEKRESLKEARDNAKKALYRKGTALPKEEWDRINKGIHTCNKTIAELRKRIDALMAQERQRYEPARKGKQNGYFNY